MYKLQKNIIAAGLSSSAFVSGAANAGLVTFEESVNTYLSQGDSLSGSFNINSFLDEQSDSGYDVLANGATIRLFGYSSETATSPLVQYAGSYSVQTGYYTYYYSYSCGWSTCYRSSTRPRYSTGYVYNNYEGDGETDVVIADFGDQQASGSTNNPDSYVTTVDSGLQRNRYHDRNEWGNVSDSVVLSGVSLNDLMSDGILDYAFTIDSGHFDSLGLFLDLDYDTKLKPVDAVSVPEPGTFGLTGLALLGLLTARIRSAKNQ